MRARLARWIRFEVAPVEWLSLDFDTDGEVGGGMIGYADIGSHVMSYGKEVRHASSAAHGSGP